MIKSLILEDERQNRDLLKHLLDKYCRDVEVVGAGESIVEGIDLIRTLAPDVVFLDVELKDGDCFELLRKIGRFDSELIFVTAHDHYAIQAIKHSALDYLLKPIVISELKDAVERIRGKQRPARMAQNSVPEVASEPNAQFGKIALPAVDGILFVAIAEIVRCEANSNYTNVYLQDGTCHLVAKTLREYESLLDTNMFVRVHHAHLVNLLFVKKYVKGKGGYVIVADGTAIDVAVRRKEALMEKLRIS